MLFRRFGVDRAPWVQPSQIWQNSRDALTQVLENMVNSPVQGPKNDSTGNKDLDELIETFGYAYDAEQDIFISRLHPWQRKIGYTRLFDELSSIMGMIIDCEPIYFDYKGRKWMLGLWKGQYDMVTGGEIGLYKGIANINVPGISSGLFYRAVGDDELIPMAFTLKKNGRVLFTREDRHWWLTGFKLGEFSKPSQLSMDVRITLLDEAMRDAVLQGLRRAGYKDREITVSGNTISFTFDKPHSPQPVTRTRVTDWIIQKKNKFLVDEFNRITGKHNTIQEKVRALQGESPEIYQKLLTIGNNRPSVELWAIAVFIVTFVIYLLVLSTDS